MTGPSRPTALLRLYRLGAGLIAPLARRNVGRKLLAQDVDPARVAEHAGDATEPRPQGRLIWFHAASVGESLSVLRLIATWGAAHPDWSFLITSGTATSARIVSERLPARTRHQFAPLDAPRYLRRFLRHWQPDAAIFVESELWPNMLMETHRAGVPLALINARISDGSARNWARIGNSARHLLGLFSHIHCQDSRTEAHFHALGLKEARAGTNLKSLSGPLPFDAAELERMTSVLQGRAVWLAASTHPGEDEIVLATHAELLKTHPGLVLILVPRHPERAHDIEASIAEAGLQGVRRSTGGAVDGSTQVYMADTLGEMGLWYALCPLTCLCGSFTPVGGHNPYEPAYAGSAVVHGPLYANFAETYARMDASGGAGEVADQAALTARIRDLLAHPDALQDMRIASRAFADAQEDQLSDFASALSETLSLG